MVNVGLRAYLWEQKEPGVKMKRELWSMNGTTYESYRAYIRYIKDFGFPDSEENKCSQTAGRPLPAGPAGPEQVVRKPFHSAETKYRFTGKQQVLGVSQSAVRLIKFGRFSADILAFASTDGSLYIASTATPPQGILQVLRGHTQRVHDLDWSHDNTFLLSCSHDGSLCLWQTEEGQLLRRFLPGGDCWEGPLTCCRFHPVNPTLVFVGSAAGEIVGINSSTGRVVCRVPLLGLALGGVGVSCLEVTTTHLVAADSRGGVHLYRCLVVGGVLQAPRLLAYLQPPRGSSGEAAWMEVLPHCTLAGGAAVVVGEAWGRLRVLQMQESKDVCVLCLQGSFWLETRCQCVLGRQSSHSTRAALCPAVLLEQPEVVAVGGDDARVHLYDISCNGARPRLIAQLHGHSSPVLDTAWSYDESLLASSDLRGTVIVWKRGGIPAPPTCRDLNVPPADPPGAIAALQLPAQVVPLGQDPGEGGDVPGRQVVKKQHASPAQAAVEGLQAQQVSREVQDLQHAHGAAGGDAVGSACVAGAVRPCL